MKPPRSVAIIGLGNMGGGMTENLLSRGYRVCGYDINAQTLQKYEQKGLFARIHAAQCAINSVVTIICVVDAVQTEHVLFGAGGVCEAAPRDHTVMLCPTIAPLDVERFAARLREQGVQTIEAPMSGGPARARDGSMSLMVACEDAVFAQHEALLRDLSSRLFRISARVGDGARTKLVNNLLAGINLVGAAEAMALAQRLGLDASRTLGVIEQSSAQSWIGSDRMRRALSGDYAPRAHMTLLAKDTRLALEMAQREGFESVLGAQAAAQFARAVDEGLADEDDGALLKLYGG
jgi:L-threonate 2-dehydrogenase